MNMSFLRTVIGDVEASQAGVCYAHEHIIIDHSFTTYCYPDFLLDSVERASIDVAEFYALGGRTLVDSMPCGGGRNAAKLSEVCRRTKVNIVCPTGLHLAKYYAPGHWGERLDAEELAGLFVADIEQGIDSADYNGPQISRTPHKAGVIKVATGQNSPNARERKIFEAAAMAHQRTGAPILTHTEQGAGALEQVRLFQEFGVPLKHVVISHTDRAPDRVYHKEVLSTGAILEYDSAFRWGQEAGNPTLDLVVTMVQEGFGTQIVLGMDAARRKYWKAYDGAPGLAFLLRDFVPRLKEAGLSSANVENIFVSNPARAYAFASLRANKRTGAHRA
jgi:predicted metal-dependent phosphotriesterase family hydrolase